MRKHSKKIGFVIVALVFALMSLGSGSSDTDTKEITLSDNVSSGDNNVDQSDNSDTKEDSNTNNSSDSSEDITIEEQVLIDENGLKVTATEYVTDIIWGDSIKLLIENDSDSSIGIGCDALIVNDFMIDNLFSSTVASGKKSNEELNLLTSELEAVGIENVGKIELYFHTFDPDTYMTSDKFDCVTIETSAYDKMDTTADDSGQELYNDNGVRIVGKYVDENSIWGTAVLLFIENNSGKNVIVQCDDMSINGFMVTPYFSCTVYDEKKAVDDITILSSDLEDNGITSVDDIELVFKILDENFSTIDQSDPISFSAH